MNKIYAKEVSVLVEQLRAVRRQIRLLRKIDIEQDAKELLSRAMELTEEEFKLFRS